MLASGGSNFFAPGSELQIGVRSARERTQLRQRRMLLRAAHGDVGLSTLLSYWSSGSAGPPSAHSISSTAVMTAARTSFNRVSVSLRIHAA